MPPEQHPPSYLPTPTHFRQPTNIFEVLRRGLQNVRLTDPTCSICYETLDPFHGQDGEGVVQIRRCSHAFHWQCLRPWRVLGNTTCPNCRVEIFTPEAHEYRTSVFDLNRSLTEDVLARLQRETQAMSENIRLMGLGDPPNIFGRYLDGTAVTNQMPTRAPAWNATQETEQQEVEATHVDRDVESTTSLLAGSARPTASTPETLAATLASRFETRPGTAREFGGRQTQSAHDEDFNTPRRVPNTPAPPPQWDYRRSPFKSPMHEEMSLRMSWANGTPRGFNADFVMDPEYLAFRRNQQNPSRFADADVIARQGLYHSPAAAAASRRRILGGNIDTARTPTSQPSRLLTMQSTSQLPDRHSQPIPRERPEGTQGAQANHGRYEQQNPATATVTPPTAEQPALSETFWDFYRDEESPTIRRVRRQSSTVSLDQLLEQFGLAEGEVDERTCHNE